MHPPKSDLPFSWEHLEKILDQLPVTTGREGGPGDKLRLSNMVHMLELDLLNRPVTSHRRVRSYC